ncbi:MAG: hypothetical protein Ta2A_20060 [Treponemataceae bacterium]|nr:MAG: hypothetical protein Ta2A_20060 [Treponemataceae bacterium]
MRKNSFFKNLLNDWPYKLICLVLASVIFGFHYITSLGQRSFSVPVIVQNFGQMVPATPFQKIVKVSFRGMKEDIAKITENDFKVYLNMDSFSKEGIYMAPLQIVLDGALMEFDPLEVRIKPDIVQVSLQENVVKEVSVESDFTGFCAPGYVVSKFSITPQRITVNGPRSFLNDLQSIKTIPIDVNDRKESFFVSIPISTANEFITPTDFHSVDIYVEIVPEIIERNITGIPIYVANLNADFAAEELTEKLSVRIKGSEAVVQNAASLEVRAVVDCLQITAAGKYTLPVHVVFPDGFEAVEQKPLEVELQITKAR